ncbi:MAG TPA: hypothetical protein VFD30_07505 [Terriglobia bacterium]|nr:hypothetical protein [Terriglobia bacterium]
MRIALNLSISAGPRERYALAWAAPVSLLAAAALVYILVTLVGGVRNYRHYHRALAELQDQERQLTFRETKARQELSRPQSREVVRQAQFINTLIDRRHFSLTALAMKVGKLLPTDVRLAGLSVAQQSEGPLVRFTVSGKGEEAVEDFLTNLEDSPEFRDVTVLNQGLEQPGNAAGTVNVTCSAYYVGEELGGKNK